MATPFFNTTKQTLLQLPPAHTLWHPSRREGTRIDWTVPNQPVCPCYLGL